MHDKSMTKPGDTPRKKGGPILKVKHGSTVVPIYRGAVRHWTRYTVSFHMNGHRVRRTFGSLEKAKVEAQLVARKIQEGKSSSNDLNPQQRDSLIAAERLVAPFNMPLVTVVDEYARCRQLLGEVPLMSAVTEFVRRTQGVQLGSKVPQIVEECLKAKLEDQVSPIYYRQLANNLARLSRAFPGEILHIKAGDIDRWLRSLGGSPVTRNSIHRCIKVLFSFAKSRSYLPGSENTAAELVPMAKTGEIETGIFTPAEMTALLFAAPLEMIGFLAIGGFAGLRVAELGRLDWSAVNLERRIIVLRATQAKTASRRIVPISDNLAAWLEPLPRKGAVVACPNLDAAGLAKKLGIEWPRNALRHSYISYRLAILRDTARVALEAGNSPDIIFKHYRELVTEEAAKDWFSILPPENWSPPPSLQRRRPLKKRILS